MKIEKTEEVTKEWFKDWANEYDETLGKVRRHHKLLDLVVRLSKVKKGEKVLDIGCGTGLLSLKFLKKADCTITDIDNSPDMLSIFVDKIKQLALSDRVACKLQDVALLDFENNSFDIVASTVTLHHLKNKYPAVKKIYKILKPGGRLVVGDIDMDTTGRLTDPKRLLRFLDYLNAELILALKEGGIDAFKRMYDNGKKHFLNDGEFCISFDKWAEICSRAKFRKVTYKPLPSFERFKVLVAVK